MRGQNDSIPTHSIAIDDLETLLQEADRANVLDSLNILRIKIIKETRLDLADADSIIAIQDQYILDLKGDRKRYFNAAKAAIKASRSKDQLLISGLTGAGVLAATEDPIYGASSAALMYILQKIRIIRWKL